MEKLRRSDKNNKDNAWTPFSYYKSTGIFSNPQGQITPQPVVGSGRISNSSELLCKLLFLASMEKSQLKIAEIMRGQHFLHTTSMGIFSNAQGQITPQPVVGSG